MKLLVGDMDLSRWVAATRVSAATESPAIPASLIGSFSVDIGLAAWSQDDDRMPLPPALIRAVTQLQADGRAHAFTSQADPGKPTFKGRATVAVQPNLDPDGWILRLSVVGAIEMVEVATDAS